MAIDRRALVLAASDDPFIPEASTSKWPLSRSVSMEIVRGGGHVGFVGRAQSPGWFWAGDRALQWIEQAVASPG
jgi:predicted alpha/beta-fold hydrolase